MNDLSRRNFLTRSLALGGLLASASLLPFKALAQAADTVTKLDLPDAEWKKRLTPAQYDILRHEGTERPFTSSLLNEHRAGICSCVGCGLALFDAKTKFESGTGWPSFYAPIAGHIETKTDTSLFMARTEYHCARCGGHHGHVFDDGPAPTGLRHCNNGAVLAFTPAA